MRRMDRDGCLLAVAAFIGSLVVLAGMIYVAGLFWPWDTTGEGAKPENYPWP